MSGKWLAIIWDNRQRVYGVRLEKSAAGALVLTQFAEAPESRKSFAERLRSVYDALTESGDELTVLGGAIADLVCVELRLPDLKPQELHEALNYQLRCLLPVEIGDIAYAFRRLPPDEPSRCRLRVEVVPKARLETLFEDIRQSGVRADLLTHPFMAVDPLLADRVLRDDVVVDGDLVRHRRIAAEVEALLPLVVVLVGEGGQHIRRIILSGLLRGLLHATLFLLHNGG